MRDERRPQVIPPMPSPPEDFRWRVVVRFRPDVQIPYEDNVQDELHGILPWAEIEQDFGPLSLDRVFFSLTELALRTLESRARSRNPDLQSASFDRYFEVECPAEEVAGRLATRLMSYPAVEHAYVATAPAAPPAVYPNDDPLYPDQRYLNAAPANPNVVGGVGAGAAWAAPGGDGTQVVFVDVEQGWGLNHQDLAAANVQLHSGLNLYYKGHGTSVLGVVLAVDNNIGCIGMGPAARGQVASQWRRRARKHGYNTEDALISVANSLAAGGIVLLEAQTTAYLPMEVEDAVFLAIELMTSVDITLIECAGNGNKDLDAYQNSSAASILNRTSAGFRDSGAVMVGAGNSGIYFAPPRARYFPSNHGTRIDCYAWGEDVVTTGDGYTGVGPADYMLLPGAFTGTSAAGAIIAGVAVCVQGMAISRLGQPLGAAAMRSLLTNPLSGTPSHNPAVDRIGIMPDLGGVLAHLGVPIGVSAGPQGAPTPP